jgi:hypothetical protein
MPKGILEIGRALIKELALKPGDDTLCRWMAHYIAELIEGAETATEADRPEKLAKCSEIILALWQHRYELPNGKRPFEEFEPIFRAIESLDPDDDTPRYFRLVRDASDKADVNANSKRWLELAEGLDYSAKMLVLPELLWVNDLVRSLLTEDADERHRTLRADSWSQSPLVC